MGNTSGDHPGAQRVEGVDKMAAGPSFSLDGKIAVVLGGGQGRDGAGNGAAIAITYARAGAEVIVADIDLDAAQRTAGQITSEGLTAHALTADVTSGASLSRLAETVHGRHGPTGVLHCNVGITRMGSPPSLDEADWRLVLDTNLTGVFLACQAFLPAMTGAGRGSVVSTSSLAAVKHTGYDYSAYYAAKAGLNQLTRTLGVQLAGTGVRVNAVMPGLIDSPLIYRQIAGSYDSAEQMIAERNRAVPMGRMGTVWEVAAAALFLASDAASYITGVCLPVDGGMSAQ
jgi:NAD(P)-dependent dehydrogenase (short-subunit alcohol dehydrogenase family)